MRLVKFGILAILLLGFANRPASAVIALDVFVDGQALANGTDIGGGVKASVANTTGVGLAIFDTSARSTVFDPITNVDPDLFGVAFKPLGATYRVERM